MSEWGLQEDEKACCRTSALNEKENENPQTHLDLRFAPPPPSQISSIRTQPPLLLQVPLPLPIPPQHPIAITQHLVPLPPPLAHLPPHSLTLRRTHLPTPPSTNGRRGQRSGAVKAGNDGVVGELAGAGEEGGEEGNGVADVGGYAGVSVGAWSVRGGRCRGGGGGSGLGKEVGRAEKGGRGSGGGRHRE